MSRIGKEPITIEEGVTVEVNGQTVKVSGSKGNLEITLHEGIKAEVKENEVFVTRSKDTKEQKALHGLNRSLIANMIEGVKNGYDIELEIQGIGYRVKQVGTSLELSLGYSHSITVEAPEGITFEVPNETSIKISGADKQKVGEIAAKIRAFKKPEPYKGKGIRYKGEHVAIKQKRVAGAE